MKKIYFFIAMVLSVVSAANAAVHTVFFQRPSGWVNNSAPVIRVWNESEPADYEEMTPVMDALNGGLYVYYSDKPFTYARFAHTDILAGNYLGNWSGVYQLNNEMTVCNSFDGGSTTITDGVMIHIDALGNNVWEDYGWDYVSGSIFYSPQLAYRPGAQFGISLTVAGKQLRWLVPFPMSQVEDDLFRWKLVEAGGSSGIQLNEYDQLYYLVLDVSTMTVSLRTGVIEDGEEPFVFDSVEDIADQLDPYYVSEFELEEETSKLSVSASHADGEMSWVKFENDLIYVSGNGIYSGEELDALSDNESILSNTTTSHVCKNYSDAYYRVYMEHTASPFGRAKVSAANRSKAARVARTIPVELQDVSTGVDDVIVDESDLSDDPMPIYYNLQGVRVEHPSAGIYICVRGNKVTKEMFR